MTRIDRYLLRESLPPLVFGLVVYVGVVVISSVVPLTQWIVGAPLPTVLHWFVLQIPGALLRSLPVSLVLAALMAIGRLAVDNELVAVRAGAIGTVRAARWFFILGAVAALAALGLEQWLLPASTAAASDVYSEIVNGSVGLYTLVGKGADLGNTQLRFRSIDRKTGTIHRVELQQWNGKRLTLLRAREGHFRGRDLVLEGYSVYGFDFGAIDSTAGSSVPLQKFVRLANAPKDPNATLTVTLSRSAQTTVQRAEAGGPQEVSSLTEAWSTSHDPQANADQRRTAALDFQRMLSEPLANLSLLLVAVPLALMYASTRGMAFGLALIVTLVWYVLLTAGQLLSQAGSLPVWLGPWMGNAVLLGAGAFLLVGRLRPG